MRNKILLLFLILFFSANRKTFAEYNGLHLEMLIEMQDGSVIHAYNYISPFYLEDTTIKYLENNFELVLRNDYNDSIGEYAFYKNRITYDYTVYENVSQAYQLLNKTKINFDAVKSVDIIDAFDFTYAIGMYGISSCSDTLWSKSPVVWKKSYGGYFCSHDIFIHEHNDNTLKVIRKLERMLNEHKSELNKLENDLKNYDGERYYEIQKQHEELEEKLDDEIYNIIDEFRDDSKVIIITMCSC